MVADRGAQILKLTARRRHRAARFHVFGAGLLVQVRKGLVTEIVKDALQPRGRFLWPRMLADDVLGINRYDVRDGNDTGLRSLTRSVGLPLR